MRTRTHAHRRWLAGFDAEVPSINRLRVPEALEGADPYPAGNDLFRSGARFCDDIAISALNGKTSAKGVSMSQAVLELASSQLPVLWIARVLPAEAS